MTPAQQSALEAVAGRALAADDIAALDPLLAPDARNDVGIAAYLSAGRVAIATRTIGIGTVLAELAPGGGAFLDALETLAAVDPNIKWGLRLLERGELDIGMTATRQLLLAVAQAAPDLAPGITTILALAEMPAPIHYSAISAALNPAEGRVSL